jgi:exopolysaccharide biosynthesis polyprenyl glycosylphosphotransferase
MTTTTSGLVPVATATELDGAVVETLVRPASQRRPLLALWVVGLDVLVAVIVAGAAAIHPSPGGTVRGAILIGWPVVIAVAGGYSRMATDPRGFPARALLAAALGMATAVWSLPTLIPGAGSGESPRTLAAAALFLAAVVCVASATARGVIALAAPSHSAPTVLVGLSSQVRELLQEASRPGGRRAFEPVAVCLPDPAADDLDSAPEAWPVPVSSCGYDGLLDVVRTHRAEAVIVAPGSGITHAELSRWVASLQHEDARLLVSLGLRDVAPHRIATATLGGSRLVGVCPAPLTGPSRLLKDVVDRVLALLLLVALAPLLGVLALLIRADSPGSALYRQTRVGWRGRPFTVYKLRTMCADADRIREDLEARNESDREGVLFKMKRDPRITRVGAILRLSSLDELPQLLNVVRGEMSLIGPRPALPGEVQAYASDLRRRLDVKPGLTGLWQVSGRSDLSWEETVRLDLQYVDNWSWRLDARIALRTAGAVLSRRGAY